MRDGVGSQLIGGAVTVTLGVLAIGAMFQLNKKNTPLVPATTSVVNNALADIFK